MAIHIRHNLDDLSRAFIDLAANHRRTIVSRSINSTAATAKTMAKRLIAREGGFKSNYVGSHMQFVRSSAATLTAEIRAQGRFSLINRFSPRYGANSRGQRSLRAARPWNTSRTYNNVFVIRARSGGGEVPLVRSGSGVKALYGPSVGREFERDYVRRPVEDHIGDKLPRETVRYAGVYMHQLKARYGL